MAKIIYFNLTWDFFMNGALEKAFLIGWAHVQLWRAILEIVVGGLVLIVGVSRR